MPSPCVFFPALILIVIAAATPATAGFVCDQQGCPRWVSAEAVVEAKPKPKLRAYRRTWRAQKSRPAAKPPTAPARATVNDPRAPLRLPPASVEHLLGREVTEIPPLVPIEVKTTIFPIQTKPPVVRKAPRLQRAGFSPPQTLPEAFRMPAFLVFCLFEIGLIFAAGWIIISHYRQDRPMRPQAAAARWGNLRRMIGGFYVIWTNWTDAASERRGWKGVGPARAADIRASGPDFADRERRPEILPRRRSDGVDACARYSERVRAEVHDQRLGELAAQIRTHGSDDGPGQRPRAIYPAPASAAAGRPRIPAWLGRHRRTA